MGTKTNDNIMKKYHGRYNVDLNRRRYIIAVPSL